MAGSNADEPSPEQIIAMFPQIAEALEGAARSSGNSPTDMQSTMWNQAVHPRQS